MRENDTCFRLTLITREKKNMKMHVWVIGKYNKASQAVNIVIDLKKTFYKDERKCTVTALLGSQVALQTKAVSHGKI